MTIPAAIFWCVALWAIFSRGPLYVYLPWLCLPFGALAVVDPIVSLGSTILPSSVALVIFVSKLAMRPASRAIMWQCAVDLRGLGLLTIFSIYAAISAYFCPRFFTGIVGVLPLRAARIDAIVALRPTSANFTQAAYTLLSCLFALAMVAYLRIGDVPTHRRHLIKAMLMGGAILAITGIIDWFGGKASLDVLRNATYAMVGTTGMVDVGRISGAFSEASGFGGTTVALVSIIYFSYSVLADGLFKKFVAPIIIALLLILSAASTSSTAYIGLAVFSLIILQRATSAVIFGALRRDLTAMGVVGLALLGICLALMFWPEIFATPTRLVNQFVLQKASSLSFMERNFWTATGYQVFWQTWGIGAGSGSTRVSSWPAAIASNLGIVGLCSMGALLLLTFSRKPIVIPPEASRFSRAAKSTMIVILAMGYFSTTTLDPGLFMALSFAVVTASSCWHPKSNRRFQQGRPLVYTISQV